MTEENSGFSFGSAPKPSDDEHDAIDAIEVNGEPVSRKEANQLGLNFDASKDNRDAKASTNIFRMDQLPKDISDDLAKKLEQAWTHLKRNEIEQALTLAQEVVWQYPALVAAKLIIARCFINRKEYEKALNILQAISENEMSAETMYYIGLAQSRLGKVKEAIAALNLSRASSADSITRKRVNDLLSHLQGEQALCPICGKKTLFDSMVEVGNRLVCANCAQSLEAEEIDAAAESGEEQLEEEYAATDTKRRKRLRRPLTRVEILLRVLLALLLLGLIFLLLYFFFPDYYSLVYSYIPGSSLMLPAPPYAPPPQRQATAPQEPRVISTLVFNSPPLEFAIAGVELRHQLVIDGMKDREGAYTVAFTPPPVGTYAMNAKTGELVWTPSVQDAGKTFAVTFGATFKNVKAKEQKSTIMVSHGLTAEKIGDWPNPASGSIVHILHDNLTGTENPELILVSGLYWQGTALIMNPAENGPGHVVAQVNLAGRPVGAGIIVAGEEKWLAVADYWNSRLRYFVFRNGSLSEIAASITLPGRPFLAGFCKDESISAVLCKTGGGYRLLAYNQVDQLKTDVIGDWSVPEDVVWRDVFIFPPAKEDAPPLIALIGGDAGRSQIYLNDTPDGVQPLKVGLDGVVVDAAQEHGKRRLHLLVKDGDAQKLVSIDLDQKNARSSQLAAGTDTTLGGLAAASLSGDDGVDLLFLSSSKVGVSFKLQGESRSKPYYWPLPSPPLLFGKPGAMRGGIGNKIVYADAQGSLWAVGLAE